MKNILKRFGYIHRDNLLEETARLLGEPGDYPAIKEIEALIFKDLSEIDGIDTFIDTTMTYDMQREFATSGDQRQLAIGAFYRMAYLKSGIKKSRDLRRKK